MIKFDIKTLKYCKSKHANAVVRINCDVNRGPYTLCTPEDFVMHEFKMFQSK